MANWYIGKDGSLYISAPETYLPIKNWVDREHRLMTFPCNNNWVSPQQVIGRLFPESMIKVPMATMPSPTLIYLDGQFYSFYCQLNSNTDAKLNYYPDAGWVSDGMLRQGLLDIIHRAMHYLLRQNKLPPLTKAGEKLMKEVSRDEFIMQICMDIRERYCFARVNQMYFLGFIDEILESDEEPTPIPVQFRGGVKCPLVKNTLTILSEK